MAILTQDFSANTTPFAATGSNTFTATGGVGVLTVTSVYTGARATLSGMTPGATVNLSIKVKASSAGSDVGIIIFLTDFSAQLINWSDNSGNWITHTDSFVVPANGSVLFDLYYGSTTGTGSFDDISVDYAVANVSGTAAQTATAVTQSATGVHSINGTAAQSFNSFTNTATATHTRHVGTAAQSFNSFTNTATGVRGAYAFIDDFTDTTGLQLQNHQPNFGVGWLRNGSINGSINAGGTWSGNSSTSNCNYNTIETIPVADYIVCGTMRFQSFPGTNTAGPGLVGRWTDNSNQYQFWVSVPNNQIAVQRILSGTSTTLATVSWTPSLNTDYRFQFKLIGNQIQITANDVVVWPSGGGWYTDATPVTGAGTAGVRGRDFSTMDNFRVQLTTNMVVAHSEATFNSFTNTATGGRGAGGTAAQSFSTTTQTASGLMASVWDAGSDALLEDGTPILLEDGTTLLLNGVFQTVSTVTQSATGTGGTTISGSAAQSFSGFTNTASGSHSRVGTADQTVPALTNTASGSHARVGTAAQSVPALTNSASGTHIPFVGTAAQTVTTVSQSASGVQSTTGTAAQSVSVTQSASATHIRHIGTATQTVPTATNSATGVQSTVGTAAQSFSGIINTASATHIPFVGTAAQTVTVTQTATGTQTGSGAAAQTITNFVNSATGTHIRHVGTASQTVAALTNAASGVQSVVSVDPILLLEDDTPLLYEDGNLVQLEGYQQQVPDIVSTSVGDATNRGTAAQVVPTIVSASSIFTVADDFVDADGTLLENHYAEFGSNWSKDSTQSMQIVGGVAVGTSASATSSYVNNRQPLTADYDVSADITITSLPATNVVGPGLFFRRQSSSDSYQAYANALVNTITIQRNTAANGTQVFANISYTFTVGQTMNWRFIGRGNKLALFIDGVQRWPTNGTMYTDVNAAAILTPGSGGIRSRSFATVDNFRLRETNTFLVFAQPVAHTVPTVTQAAVANYAIGGTAAQSFNSFVSNGVGTQSIGGVAAQTLVPTQTATGSFLVFGTAAQTVVITSAASAQQQYGSAVQTITNIDQTATGTRGTKGTATHALPSVVSNAVGSQMIGTAAQVVPALVQAATGALTVLATATQTFTVSGTATGTLGHTGTGGTTLSNPTQDATGYQQFGVAAQVLSPLVTQSVSGVQRTIGTAGSTVAAPTQSASGTHLRHVGSAAHSIIVSQSATGYQPPIAVAAQVVPPLVTVNSPYVVKDTVTDTDGTTLANHTPEIGGAWSADPTATIVIQSNKAVGSSGTSTSSYQNGQVMTNRDYDVVADITITSMPGSNLPGPGLFARYVDDSNQNQLYFNPFPGTITIQRTKAGSTSVYNNVGFTQVVGQTYNVRWIFRGGSTALFIDGVKVWPSGSGLFFDSNSLTDPGKAGIRSRNFGTLDNFQVQYAAEITAAGNAAQVVPVSQSVSGSHSRVGSAASTIAITQAATGQHRIDGSSNRSFNLVTQSASGQHSIGGSASQVVPITQSATGLLSVSGNAAQVVPITQNVSGVQATVATGSVNTVITVVQAAQVMLGNVSYFNVTLSPVNQNATGTQTTLGSAVQAVTITQEAYGERRTVGGAAHTLIGQFFTQSAKGRAAVNGNAVQVFSNFVNTAVARQEVSGNAVQTVSLVSNGVAKYGVWATESVFNDFRSDGRGGFNVRPQRGQAKRFGFGFRF